MKYATAIIFTLALLVTGACGGGDYQAPPKSNSKPVTQTPESNGKKPTGPSQAKEFEAEVKLAEPAWRKFKSDKTKDNYVEAMVHMFKAMTYKNLHIKYGHPESALTGYSVFKRDYWADKSKTAPPAGADHDPRYVEAKKAFDESQSSE
ncbi:MAG: hypothetical protein KDB82_00685 [Planctomycetes bacterium]|nr:hypothetical protein [Planctomycetota bacterium]